MVHVIAYNVLTDFLGANLGQANPRIRGLLSAQLRLRAAPVVNAMAGLALKRSPVLEWSLSQSMHVTGTSSPHKYLQTIWQFHTADVPPLVKQDVLLLAGSQDHYVPAGQLHQQIKTLTNARSITARLFTQNESAQNHCQVGNYGLALRTMVDWLDGLHPPYTHWKTCKRR